MSPPRPLGPRKFEGPVFHPAGADNELRKALEEVSAGRWMAMSRLLRLTDRAGDTATWARRTQILGAIAARSDVVEVWRAEEPGSTAVVVMAARVATFRALQAHRIGLPDTRQRWREANDACRAALAEAPEDPVPWVCLLAQAELDVEQSSPEHRQPSPDGMAPPGPWGLLGEVHARDPYSREGFHLMMRYLIGRGGGSLSHADAYARWAVDWARGGEGGEALLMLPVYLHMERWLGKGGRKHALDLHWIESYALRDAELALGGWFDVTGSDARSLQDTNYLAHALWAAQQFEDAARVFASMGRYATTRPWQYRVADPDRLELVGEEFRRIREHCMEVRDAAEAGSRSRAGPRFRRRPS